MKNSKIFISGILCNIILPGALFPLIGFTIFLFKKPFFSKCQIYRLTFLFQCFFKHSDSA